jgi:hypothetical protein
MKQYLSPEQTAKLIELGFEKPSSIASVEPIYGMGGISVAKAYTIGELIEMLPREINNDVLPDRFGVYIDHNKLWTVEYSNIFGELFSTYRTELIDALYDMVVKLKEEGVI